LGRFFNLASFEVNTTPRVASIPGATVEHNTFCVSAHYRNCEGENWADVIAAVEEIIASDPDSLRMTRGRKVCHYCGSPYYYTEFKIMQVYKI
jgi:trehalose-6-phosphatase